VGFVTARDSTKGGDGSAVPPHGIREKCHAGRRWDFFPNLRHFPAPEVFPKPRRPRLDNDQLTCLGIDVAVPRLKVPIRSEYSKKACSSAAA
jgi:hypothetical protein